MILSRVVWPANIKEDLCWYGAEGRRTDLHESHFTYRMLHSSWFSSGKKNLYWNSPSSALILFIYIRLQLRVCVCTVPVIEAHSVPNAILTCTEKSHDSFPLQDHGQHEMGFLNVFSHSNHSWGIYSANPCSTYCWSAEMPPQLIVSTANTADIYSQSERRCTPEASTRLEVHSEPSANDWSSFLRFHTSPSQTALLVQQIHRYR